jgi:hypothetical protein
MEKPMIHLTPKRVGRPPGAKNDKRRSRGTLSVRFDEELKGDLELLRAHYRQQSYASVIRMAIAQLARMVRQQGQGDTR